MSKNETHEEYLARRRDKYRENHAAELERCRKHRAENRDSVRMAQKKYKTSEAGKKKRLEHYAQNRARMSAVSREWHRENKERCYLSREEWGKKNRQRLLDANKLRRSKNPEFYLEKERAHRAKVIHIIREQRRENYRKNPDLRLSHNRNRAAKKKAAVGSHSAADVAARKKWQRNKCAYCRENLSKKYHVDHIKPLALGGSNLPSNLQILCGPCNLKKSARPPEEFARRLGLLL